MSSVSPEAASTHSDQLYAMIVNAEPAGAAARARLAASPHIAQRRRPLQHRPTASWPTCRRRAATCPCRTDSATPIRSHRDQRCKNRGVDVWYLPQSDEGWNEPCRGETEAERLQPKMDEASCETVGTQPMCNLLTSYLLILPFQQGFAISATRWRRSGGDRLLDRFHGSDIGTSPDARVCCPPPRWNTDGNHPSICHRWIALLRRGMVSVTISMVTP